MFWDGKNEKWTFLPRYFEDILLFEMSEGNPNKDAIKCNEVVQAA